MRSDPQLDFSGVGSPDLLPGRAFQDGVSQSGRERNHLFVNAAGAAFVDVSGVSGLDDVADGRAFAWLDFDRDGWLDVAVVNANAPLFQLFRNELGAAVPDGEAGVVAIELEGGNHAPEPAPGWSARDATGARVELRLADGTELVRELRAGEGLAAQNSRRLLFGVGAAAGADSVRVRWPSGRVDEVGPVEAGTLVKVRERGPTVERTAYGAQLAAIGRAPTPAGAPLGLAPTSGEALHLVTTFATWCEVCRSELPQLARMREAFPESALALHGVPVDPEDDPAKLARWSARYDPPYRVRDDLSAAERAHVAEQVRARLRRDALPASFVTDGEGRVLAAQWGVPTISDVRLLQAQQGGAARLTPREP